MKADPEKLAEIRRLRLAQSDMRQVIVAAENLLQPARGDLDRVLETGLAVCYWRPFSGNRIGRLEPEWFPQDASQRRVHDHLKTLRDQVFAHSDETVARGVEDVGNLFGSDFIGLYVEAWKPLSQDFIREVRALAADQEARFKARAHELEDELRGGAPRPI